LIIDEVLAVGDAALQKRCLGKMEGMARSGRTVLFVSHNMVAVEKLCTRSIYIEDGRCTFIGTSGEAVRRYLHSSGSQQAGSFASELVRSDGRAELLGYTIVVPGCDAEALPRTHDQFEVRIRVRLREAIERPACSISIYNQFSTLMTAVNTTEQGIELDPLPPGETEIAVVLGPITYLPGSYRMTFELVNPQGHIYAAAAEAIHFEIGQRPLYGTRDLDHRWGCVFTPVAYRIRSAESPSAPALLHASAA